MSRKYKFRNPEAAYFVSFATCFWIDVFTRQCYFSILEQSLSFCRSVKKMCVYAYCFMPSHVHLIFRAEEENPSEILRDFKAYTANECWRKLKLTHKKAGKNGCWKYLQKTSQGSFGNTTTSLLNYGQIRWSTRKYIMYT